MDYRIGDSKKVWSIKDKDGKLCKPQLLKVEITYIFDNDVMDYRIGEHLLFHYIDVFGSREKAQKQYEERVNFILGQYEKHIKSSKIKLERCKALDSGQEQIDHWYKSIKTREHERDEFKKEHQV